MLYTVNQNDLFILEDLVDDAVVTAAGRPKPFEFADQWLSKPVRVLNDRPEDGLQSSVPHVVGETVKVA